MERAAHGDAPAAAVLGAAAAPGERLCQKGCGYKVAPGADRWGRPYDTCCRGCAMNAGHDIHCLRTCAGVGDADLALAMQMEEMRVQQLYQQQQEVMSHVWQQQQNFALRENQLWDPLFGEVTLAPGLGRRFCQHATFACCPCAMIGCGGPARRIWRRFLLSWSFGLGLLQVVLLLVAIALQGGHMPFERNPMLGPHYHVFDRLGAKNAARIRSNGEWWRLLTPLLLHAGWLHLLGNLTVQLRTGAMLEAVWGSSAWLCIYLAAGAYGVLASCVMTPDYLGVGSSGALCGLLGGWGSFLLITWNQTSPVDIKLRNAQTVSVGFSMLIIIGLSFLPLMDFAAHVGGLLMGAAVAMVLFAGRLQTVAWSRATRASGVFLLVALVGVTLGLFLAMTEPDAKLLRLCQPPEC